MTKFKTNIPKDFGKRYCFTVVSDTEEKNKFRVAKVIEHEETKPDKKGSGSVRTIKESLTTIQ